MDIDTSFTTVSYFFNNSKDVKEKLACKINVSFDLLIVIVAKHSALFMDLDIKNFPFVDYCVDQIKQELIKSERSNLMNNAIYQVFPFHPKNSHYLLFHFIWFILKHFELPVHKLVFVFCENGAITHNSAPVWTTAVQHIINHNSFFDNKELRKLFYVFLEKAAILTERVPETDEVIRNISDFLTMISREGKIPRVLILNELSKNNRYLPVIGVTNITESIWWVDSKTFLFKNSILFRHFHNFNSEEHEINYILNVFRNSYRYDVICTIFDVPKSSKHFGSTFYACLIRDFKDLSQDICQDTNSLSTAKDCMNILIRSFSEFICIGIFKDTINLHQLYKHMRKFLEENETPTLIKSVAVTVIGECLPMCKANLGVHVLGELAGFIRTIYDSEIGVHVERPDSVFLLQSLFQTWMQIMYKCREELIFFNVEPPLAISQLITHYTENIISSIPDIFNSDYAFYINIFANRSFLINKCYAKLLSFYSGISGNIVKLPKGLEFRIDPEYMNINYAFFSQIKCFPLTQLCLYIVNYILSKAENEKIYIIPPPLLEILHLITLGDLGNSIRFVHNIITCFNKCIKMKAYYILNAFIEMFTYKSFLYIDISNVSILFRLVAGLETLCLEHKELLLYTNTFVVSLLTRIPKINHSFVPIFFQLFKNGGLAYHYPDVNMLFIYHMCHSCFFYGPHKKTITQLVAYIKSAIVDVPHTWNSHFLSRLPKEIQDVYQNILDFDQSEIMSSIMEIKRNASSGDVSAQLEKMLCHSKYQRSLLCVIFDNLMGEPLGTLILFGNLKLVRFYNLLYSIRVLIFYIVVVRKYTPDNTSMDKVVKSLIEMMWVLHIFTLDQMILSLLMFHYKGIGISTIFYLIEIFLSHENIGNCLSCLASSNGDDLNKYQLKNNVEFHRKFYEYFDNSQINVNIGIDNKTDYQNPTLPIYYGNLIYRLSFYIDLILWRSLETSEPEIHFKKMISVTWMFISYHPCPILSLFVILSYYNETIKNINEERDILIQFFLTRKYSHSVIEQIFTSELYSKLYYPDKSFVNVVSFSEKILLKLASSLFYPRSKLITMYGKTVDEFQNYHSYQILVCCVLELLIFMDKSVFSNTIISIFLDNSSSIYNFNDHGIDFQHFIQAFGLILSIVPYDYVIECVQILASSVGMLQEFDSNADNNNPSLLDLTSDTYSTEFSTSSVIMLLFRSYLFHIPLGILTTYFQPSVQTEFQFILITSSIIPCLQRFSDEADCLDIYINISTIFAQIIQFINDNTEKFIYPCLVSDFFYIVKYKYIGDKLKDIFNELSINFKPELKKYLSLI
ncbi:hypothetical protein MXB_4143 [Myxobolus squamalis]|nr:hypothetical protein MXB_4143 [Myxobolus squamalis]